MCLIDAEYDGFRHPVVFIHEFRQVACDRLSARTQRNHTLEILCLVLVIGYRAAVAVEIIPARPPACSIPFGNDAMHAIRREKTIIYALPQTVFVNRIAE